MARSAIGAFAGAILAGGASHRMGTDKAFIEVDGTTMLQRAAEALCDAGATTVTVIGGDEHKIIALGLRYLADAWPAQGPLGGIITALRHARTNTVAVLSCDLTQPNAAAIRALRQTLGSKDIAVPVVNGQREWLHAVWHQRSLPALERAFAHGERAPKRAVQGVQVIDYEPSDPTWFNDADYPHQLPKTPPSQLAPSTVNIRHA